MNPFFSRPVSAAGGGGGGSPTDDDTRQLQDSAHPTLSFVREDVKWMNGITSWTTILTINFSGTFATAYGRGIVEASIAGLTNTVGSGARHVRRYFDYAGGVLTVGGMGTDQNSGLAPPNFRLNVNGQNVELQVQSSDGTNSSQFTCYTKIITPIGANISGWTIT